MIGVAQNHVKLEQKQKLALGLEKVALICLPIPQL